VSLDYKLSIVDMGQKSLGHSDIV